MPRYIMLLTLTPDGREKMHRDAQSVLRASSQITGSNARILGLYGVLGQYDFIGIVEATDNESVARFSLQLGVSAGLHITTLPAIPIGRMEGAQPNDVPETEIHGTPTPADAPSEADQSPYRGV